MHVRGPHKVVSSLMMECRRKHLVSFICVHIFDLLTFEKHTLGTPPFGFTSDLNVKAFVAFFVQTTLHWHVMEEVVLNLIFASLTSVTSPEQSGISLAEMVYW